MLQFLQDRCNIPRFSNKNYYFVGNLGISELSLGKLKNKNVGWIPLM